VQDYVANGWWPPDSEWRRHRSAHYEINSSSENVDQNELPWSVNTDDEDRRLDGRQDGRRGGRLNGGRDGEVGNGWYGRRNGRRDGGLVGGRVGGWDGTPRSSYRGTQVKLIFYWDKCCQRRSVPDTADNGYYTSDAVHHNHHDYADGSSNSVSYSGRPIDRRGMALGAHHRRAQSSRRQSSRLVHGTDWF